MLILYKDEHSERDHCLVMFSSIALEKWNSGHDHHYLSLIIILAQIISYGYQ